MCMCRTVRMQFRRKKRGAVIFLLLLCLLCQAGTGISAKTAPIVYSQSGAAGAVKSICELKARWDAICVPTSRFSTAPSVKSPYSPGKLSDSMTAQGVDYVNFIRYTAGLPMVSANEADNRAAQYGAMLLAASDTLSHTPPRPSDMSLSLYQTCVQALAQSNISCLKFSVGASRDKLEKTMPLTIWSYMNEQGRTNRGVVAHRRWILNPELYAVGFGCADANTSTEYQVLKILDTAKSGQSAPDYQFIAWPSSGAFPAQAINCKNPWSITLNPALFQIPGRNDLTVTITRDDGKSWTLNRNTSADAGEEEFLLVNTQSYGVPNCIIFAFPTGQIGKLSGSYHVTVSGLHTLSGREAMLDYTTAFADMENTDHAWTDWVTTAPADCTEAGAAYRSCKECGLAETKTLEPLGHAWKQTAVLSASEKYAAGKAEFVCTRCGAEKTDALPLLLCNPAECPCTAFEDLPAATNWAHNGIDFVIENNIFTGINATTFAPKNTMTRAMMITVLWRMAGKPAGSAAADFSDVPSGQYYTQAVAWGVENGIVSGMSADRFAPGNAVTREQAITFLYRLYGSEETADGAALSDFADEGSIHSYARSAALWAVQNDILNGNTRNCLCPRDSITREQAAAIIMRCMQP